MVDENTPALSMLEAARGKKGAKWEEYFATPMCDTEVQRDRNQRLLSQLVQAKVLLAHHQENDRAAIAGIFDLLMMSNAIEEMLPGFSHPDAAAVASAACERLIEIAPELRIGDSEAFVNREDVIRLIRALENESSLVDGQMRYLRWHRASHAEATRAVQDERCRPAFWRGYAHGSAQ